MIELLTPLVEQQPLVQPRQVATEQEVERIEADRQEGRRSPTPQHRRQDRSVMWSRHSQAVCKQREREEARTTRTHDEMTEEPERDAAVLLIAAARSGARVSPLRLPP